MTKHVKKELFYLIFVLLLSLQLQTISASSHMATTGSTKAKGMYLPIMFKTKEPPPYTCYHFRKVCYLPGVSSGWRGWYREGFSGYYVHGSWMYYMSKVRCPCLFPMPPTPQGVGAGSVVKHS